MTVAQLKKVLSVVPNDANVGVMFKFSGYSTEYGAQIKSVTVNCIGNENEVSVTMNIEENEEEKAAMAEAQAA